MNRFFSGDRDGQGDGKMNGKKDGMRDGAGDGETGDTPSGPPSRGGLFSGLSRTRQGLFGGIASLFRGASLDESAFEEIEDQLLVADVGVDASRKIVEHLRREARQNRIGDEAALGRSLRAVLTDLLAPCQGEPLAFPDGRPLVVMMVGVNGVGKTTTLAKVAARYRDGGAGVMLAACDTFRAAAIEQLQAWGERLGVPVVAQGHGADAAAVAFDAYGSACARGMSLLLVDTAGRQHTHGDLVEQLKKVKRVLGKADPSVPDEVWLTVDAGNGQNVLSQVTHFHEAVQLTGICITKLDGTARGGVILALADRFGIPVRYVGTGEKAGDLRPFDAGEFVEALLPGPPG